MSSEEHPLRNRVLALVCLVIGFQGVLQGSAEADPGKCQAGLLDPFCEAGKTVLGKAGEIVAAPVRAAAGGAVDMLTSWVADGAQWLLGKVVAFIDHSTTPDLGASWFTERYQFMVRLAALVLLPMLLIAAIRAVMNQDVSQLLRSFFLYLPIAILGTFVAVFLTQTLLAVTDAMSQAVARGVAGDVSQIFDSVGKGLGTAGGVAPAAPSFAIFFGALVLILGSFFVWLELLVRSATVTVSVFFLPLMLASLVWPATSRWTRRLVETLVALILSKFVIVAVISLATAALADPGGGGFGSVMGAAALMLMAAFSPMALLKLMPLAEGAAMSHLEGVGRKPIQAMRPAGSVNQAASIMRSKLGSRGPSSQVGVAGANGAGPAGAAAAAGAVAARSAEKVANGPGRGLEKARNSRSGSTPSAPADGKVGGAVNTNSGATRPTRRGPTGGRNDG
jgi:type IV secretion system protein TrbL